MKRVFYAILCAASLLSGCAKEVKLEYPLTFFAKRNDLSTTAGSTNVIIYANYDWTLSMPECDWASIDRTSGSGTGKFVFTYEENTGYARKVVITANSDGQTAYIEMVQKSAMEDITIVLHQTSVSASAVSGQAIISYESTVPESCLQDIVIVAKDEQGADVDWISDMTVVNSSRIAFNVAENATGAERKAVVNVSYTDDFGTKVAKELTIVQSKSLPYVGFDASVVGVKFPSVADVVTIPFSTNLTSFLPGILTTVKSSASWAKPRANSLYTPAFDVSLKANTTTSDRMALITMTYTSLDGTEYPFNYILVQKAK